MIKYVNGDLFNSPAQVLVNTVNIDGVMGKGIALKFKKKYPEMFKKYKMLCENKQLDVGKLWLYKASDYTILNFPTKKHWRNPSQYEYVESGLKKFVDSYQEKGITSIAFPRLGCGNGGLEWEKVKVLMEKYLDPLPIDVYVYQQEKTITWKEHEDTKSMKEWISRDAKNMSFLEFYNDLECRTSLLPAEMNKLEHDLKNLWSRLCNEEIIVLDTISFTKDQTKLQNAILNLSYIEICEVSNGKENKTAIHIKNHKNFDGASSL